MVREVTESPPAPLTRPPVLPLMFAAVSFGFKMVLVELIFISRALTATLLPTEVNTVDEMVLLVSAPLPLSKPAAEVITFVLKVEVCTAASSNSPDPRLVRSMGLFCTPPTKALPVPIVAFVLLTLDVFGSAEAPAATPPLPAVVSA